MTCPSTRNMGDRRPQVFCVPGQRASNPRVVRCTTRLHGCHRVTSRRGHRRARNRRASRNSVGINKDGRTYGRTRIHANLFGRYHGRAQLRRRHRCNGRRRASNVSRALHRRHARQFKREGPIMLQRSATTKGLPRAQCSRVNHMQRGGHVRAIQRLKMFAWQDWYRVPTPTTRRVPRRAGRRQGNRPTVVRTTVRRTPRAPRVGVIMYPGRGDHSRCRQGHCLRSLV